MLCLYHPPSLISRQNTLLSFCHCFSKSQSSIDALLLKRYLSDSLLRRSSKNSQETMDHPPRERGAPKRLADNRPPNTRQRRPGRRQRRKRLLSIQRRLAPGNCKKLLLLSVLYVARTQGFVMPMWTALLTKVPRK